MTDDDRRHTVTDANNCNINIRRHTSLYTAGNNEKRRCATLVMSDSTQKGPQIIIRSVDTLQYERSRTKMAEQQQQDQKHTTPQTRGVRRYDIVPYISRTN